MAYGVKADKIWQILVRRGYYKPLTAPGLQDEDGSLESWPVWIKRERRLRQVLGVKHASIRVSYADLRSLLLTSVIKACARMVHTGTGDQPLS